MTTQMPYHLGCPAWSCRDWIGSVFPASTPQNELLRRYAKLFNSVEGNTFFYALPKQALLEQWMAETPDGFRFAPKFPKAITHEHRLHRADEETKTFLSLLEKLADGNRLGVSFLQLPPSFNIHNFDTLEAYLAKLPQAFAYALEPRHISWFDEGDNEKRLDELLIKQGIDKVIFDSRPLFSDLPDDREEREAQERKPHTPVRKVALGQRPVLRFVGRNQAEKNEQWIKEWAPIINKWILEKKEPYIFAHAADDANAPYVARRLHQQLQKLNPFLPSLPEYESDHPRRNDTQEQLNLF